MRSQIAPSSPVASVFPAALRHLNLVDSYLINDNSLQALIW